MDGSGRPEPGTPGFTADWARQLGDPAAFRAELERLGHTWTFLGLTRDVPADGDWITASIGLRSVFVQRFGSELRGFLNVCAHRGYPLRQGPRGNGPVRCDVHHWQYNRDGRAAGIPICNLVFGKPPHEVGARLQSVKLAVCGSLIFGRFPSAQATGSLEDYLGDAYPIVEAMTRIPGKPLYLEMDDIRAHWKLNMHFTMDDYHAPHVHPSTLGKDGVMTDLAKIHYVRLGSNSAYLLSEDKDCFAKLLDGCRRGTYRSNHFFILQILPNLAVAHVGADMPFWFCNIIQFLPQAPDRTRLRSWSYPAPFESDLSRFDRLTRPLTDPFRRRIFMHYFKKVMREDVVVCENLQKVLPGIAEPPMLGALETRIGWFEESLRALGTPAAKTGGA